VADAAAPVERALDHKPSHEPLTDQRYGVSDGRHLLSFACDLRRRNEFSERLFSSTRKRTRSHFASARKRRPNVMMKKLGWLVLSTLVMVGCGGPSQPSIDHSKKLSALSESERQDTCAWTVGTMGGDGHEITCDGQKFTFKTEICLNSLKNVPAGCTATFGDLASCTEAQSKDFCGGAWLSNSACMAISSCGMSM